MSRVKLLKVIDFIKKNPYFTTKELVGHFGASRQYMHSLVKQLLKEGMILKTGSTHNASYVLKESFKKEMLTSLLTFTQSYQAKNLEEHAVLEKIEKDFPMVTFLPENIKSIFDFAFSEMLNNAIEHSKTNRIFISLTKEKDSLSFTISDAGVGVFRNIMNTKKLNNEDDAIGELLKGKATTVPRSHSGEGIFFTSRVVDLFVLESFGKQLYVNTPSSDIKIESIKKGKRGTSVSCTISLSTHRHLSDVFKKYTNLTEASDYGFDKTEIRVKLYSKGGVYISRSQARRILSGLEKFSIVVFDFENVSIVGQAFADEIFRVFTNAHPKIRLETVHMNDAVIFMVKRAINESKRK